MLHHINTKFSTDYTHVHTCTNKYRHWVRLGLGRGRNIVFILIKVPALEAKPVEISSQSSGGILFLFLECFPVTTVMGPNPVET